MNSFDLPEIPEPVISWGIKGLVLIGVIAVGTVIFKKAKEMMKPVKLIINNFRFDDSSTVLNVTVENLKDSKILLVFHFEYKDFASKKFTINLSGRQIKTFDISEAALPKDTDAVDSNSFKLVIDEVKNI